MSLRPLLNPEISAPITITTMTPMATPRMVRAARALLALRESSAMPAPSNLGATGYSNRSAAMGSRRAARLAGYTPARIPTPAPSRTPSATEAGDDERDENEARSHDEQDATDLPPKREYAFGGLEREVVVLAGPQAMAAAHHGLRFFHGGSHLRLGRRLHDQGVDHARRVHLALDRRHGGGNDELVERHPEQVAAPLRHADDPVGDAVDADGVPDRVARLEQALGEIVAEHHHGRPALVLLRRERAALGDPNVLDREVRDRGAIERYLRRFLGVGLDVAVVLRPPRGEHGHGEALGDRVRIGEGDARPARPRAPRRVADVGG